MDPTSQSPSSQQNDFIPSSTQYPLASYSSTPNQPAPAQPTIKNRPVIPPLHFGSTSPVTANARGGATLPRASSSPDAPPKGPPQNHVGPDQPAGTAEGGSKRTIDGKDGPGSKERRESKRQRGNSTEERHPAEMRETARVTAYEDKPTEKKLVRIRRETDLKERGKLSPRRAAPGSPVANALQTASARDGTSASTAQSHKAAWRRSSQAPKPDAGKPSGITLSPRRGSDAGHAGASQPVYQADLATISLPTLLPFDDEFMFNDSFSFSFAPCDEDEHGAIDARNAMSASPEDATPGKTLVPDGLSGNAAEVPGPTSDSQPVGKSPASQAPSRFPSETLSMLESVLREWDEQMPADSDKSNSDKPN